MSVKSMHKALMEMATPKTERATWVPESIADEQVEAFMEATLTAVTEGADTFVFEGKSYKAKSKKEAKKLDPVGKADADIDNDGDVDSSDEYLKNRRNRIRKAMENKEKSCDCGENKKCECEIDEGSKPFIKYDGAGAHVVDGQGKTVQTFKTLSGADYKKKAQEYLQKHFEKLAMESVAESAGTAQHGPDDATSDTYAKQVSNGHSGGIPKGTAKDFLATHSMEVGLDAEVEYMKNKAEAENALKRTPARMGDKLSNGDNSFVKPIKTEIIDGITKALQQMKTNS